MEIRLSPELEALVEREVASGRYNSVDEYIAKAVETLDERELWSAEDIAHENALFEQSVAEAERGELMDENEVRRRMTAMKAEWRTGRLV